MTRMPPSETGKRLAPPAGYEGIHDGIVELLDAARQAAARNVNALMTASYWDIGRRIVEAEQKGRPSISQTVSGKLRLSALTQAFTLPWSAYVRLLSVKDDNARRFYHAEALRGGWSVRQLDRQIESQFYQRTALSGDKVAMLAQGARPQTADAMTPGEAIKDPYVLEFLDLKDEYSESDLEAALTQRLEDFLLELGEGFTFVGRQRRLRIDQTWHRVDLLLYHRKLRCLVIIDLKLGSLSHSDVGQMHMYCNYAKAHWAYPDENPPVGVDSLRRPGQRAGAICVGRLADPGDGRELPDGATRYGIAAERA